MDEQNTMVTITINKNQYRAIEGEILLPVLVREKIDIPHLCYEESLDPYGACRLCMVEIVTCGKTEMTTACTIRVHNGLEILTDTPDIIRHRRFLFELYLAEAPKSDSIRKMAEKYGVSMTRFLKKIVHDDPLGGKCILCGLCVRVCNEVMGAHAIAFINRGPYTVVNTPFLEENPVCMGCGACAGVCPTHAIVIEDLNDERIMRSWSGTKIKRIRCARCGTFFGPGPVVQYAVSRLDPGLVPELENLCHACRGKQTAQKMIMTKNGDFSTHV